jgi:cytochrome b6-f complex iron-sulfur subunit
MMEKETHSRRSFLNKLWLVLGGLAFAELIAVVFTYFRPTGREAPTTPEDTIIKVGPVDNFETGTVSAFVAGKFYLARLEDGGFLAMSRRCTHLSCTVPWVSSENKFICPCHASEFDIRGEVASPPAPRALDLYEINIRNNVLSVDTGKLTKRSVFAPNQVTYPKSI